MALDTATIPPHVASTKNVLAGYSEVRVKAKQIAWMAGISLVVVLGLESWRAKQGK